MEATSKGCAQHTDFSSAASSPLCYACPRGKGTTKRHVASCVSVAQHVRAGAVLLWSSTHARKEQLQAVSALLCLPN
eukprot:3877881-Amphidinium_carterae.1